MNDLVESVWLQLRDHLDLASTFCAGDETERATLAQEAIEAALADWTNIELAQLVAAEAPQLLDSVAERSTIREALIDLLGYELADQVAEKAARFCRSE